MPQPVTTPSPNGRFFSMPNVVERCRANASNSVNEPSSSRASMRSRAVILPLACCFSTARSEPAWIASSKRCCRSASLPAVVCGSGWSEACSGCADMAESLVRQGFRPQVEVTGPPRRSRMRDRSPLDADRLRDELAARAGRGSRWSTSRPRPTPCCWPTPRRRTAPCSSPSCRPPAAGAWTARGRPRAGPGLTFSVLLRPRVPMAALGLAATAHRGRAARGRGVGDRRRGRAQVAERPAGGARRAQGGRHPGPERRTTSRSSASG